MGLKTSVLGLSLLLFSAPFSLQAQQLSPGTDGSRFASLDSELSTIYVDQGKSAFAKSDWTTLSNLLGVALEFDSGNSDAYYLRGEMEEKVGHKIPEAIASYEEALNHSQWKRFTESECRLKLAPLLIRTKQYSRALHVLDGLASTSRSYFEDYAKAQIGAKQLVQARNILVDAQAAFPRDVHLTVLRISCDPTYRNALARQYLSSSGSAPPERGALEALISSSVDPQTKRSLVVLYDKLYPFSAIVFGESLLAAASVSPADIDKYASNGLLANGKLTESLYAALPAGPAKSRLEVKVASYTGSVDLDVNGDGIAEETADYQNGQLTRLSVDFDQDGVPEYDIALTDGTPNEVTTTVNGTSYKLVFGRYPFVASATSESGAEMTTYTLEPGQMSYSLFGGRPTVPAAPSSFPPLVVRPSPITARALFAFAVEVQSTNTKTKAPVSLWKRSINDILLLEKQWSSGKYAYKAVYHGGQKFSAEIDVDNDGYYEVHEYYRDGKLYEVTYDGNHKAVPEFTLVLEPYPILSWDFNQDGLIDEIEKQVNAKTTVLEFSTKMNGVFDVITREVTK